MRPLLVLELGAILGAMTVLWTVSLARRDVSIVDIFWGLAFVLLVWLDLALCGVSLRMLLLAALTTLWGVRLAAYLAWRNHGHGEDFRYARMRRAIGPSFRWKSLFLVFWLQGILVWVISLPLTFTALASHPALSHAPADAVHGGPPFGLLDAAGVIVFLIGLAFETVGDLELAAFKRDPANAGRVLDRGLWRYTRHPNYFGDCAVWWGLYLVALAGGAPWWTAVGPTVMTVLLLRVSGVALLEKDIGERRPEYADYVRRTSAFVPWFPRS